MTQWASSILSLSEVECLYKIWRDMKSVGMTSSARDVPMPGMHGVRKSQAGQDPEVYDTCRIRKCCYV